MDDKNLLEYLFYGVSGLFGTWLMHDRTQRQFEIEDLEERVRNVEQHSIGEKRVRQMIEDVVLPIKESQVEIRGDVKEVLRLMVENRH